jgi:hypothetical protein
VQISTRTRRVANYYFVTGVLVHKLLRILLHLKHVPLITSSSAVDALGHSRELTLIPLFSFLLLSLLQ